MTVDKFGYGDWARSRSRNTFGMGFLFDEINHWDEWKREFGISVLLSLAFAYIKFQVWLRQSVEDDDKTDWYVVWNSEEIFFWGENLHCIDEND